MSSRTPDRAPFRKAVVIANPIAGRGRAAAAANTLAHGLERLGIERDVFLTRARGDATARASALESGVDLLVAVGGDGTVNEVLAGLGGRDVPIAIVPFGTANVMSLDLRLPRDVEGALAMIAARKTSRLDVARVNDRDVSFLVTGIGFDAQVVRELERTRTGSITKLDWGHAALRAFWNFAPVRLRVTLDGEKLAGEYGFVLVANIVHYAGLNVLAADRRIDDGRFEVYLFEKGSKASLIGYAVRGLLRGFPCGTCTLRRARSIAIESDAPVHYQVDGDLRGVTPIEIVVDDRQHTLLIP